MWDITPDEKLNMGHSAVQTILKDLLERRDRKIDS